jgi:hypothetical protein
MRHAPRALLAGGLGFAVSFLVACGGGSGLLTGNQADTLNSQLDQVSAAFQSGQCGAAASAATAFSNAIENLPASVNASLINNLRQGASAVGQLTATNCRTQSTTTTATTPTSSTTSSTATTTSTTSSTNTTATQTITTPATTSTGSGTTTSGGTGGAGLGNGNGNGGSGGAGTGNGNGNGNGQ